MRTGLVRTDLADIIDVSDVLFLRWPAVRVRVLLTCTGRGGGESDGGGEGGLGGTRWWCEIESDRARPVQQAQETWQGSGACINMDDGPNCIFDAGAQRGMTDCSLTSYHLDSGSQARLRA